MSTRAVLMGQDLHFFILLSRRILIVHNNIIQTSILKGVCAKINPICAFESKRGSTFKMNWKTMSTVGAERSRATSRTCFLLRYQPTDVVSDYIEHNQFEVYKTSSLMEFTLSGIFLCCRCSLSFSAEMIGNILA